MAHHARLAALILPAAALGACSGSLTVNLADTPVDGASSVVVDFTGIELHATNGKTVNISFRSPRQIDLLQLANGTTAALAQSEPVPAGDYDWMQLEVLADKDTQGESFITLANGTQYPLYIPAGSEATLKLTAPFTVTEGRTTELIIEFNLRQSVTSTDGQNYTLVPAMRLVSPRSAGTLTVSIDLAALATAQLGASAPAAPCQGGLFVFAGSAVKPQNGGGTSLVELEPIPAPIATTTSSLSIRYLAPGSYTIAATCDYGLYDPATQPGASGYQALHWAVLDNVSVNANATTTDTLPSGTSSNIVN